LVLLYFEISSISSLIEDFKELSKLPTRYPY
jgi:hypothetical protein